MSAISWEIDEPGSWSLETVHFPTPVTAYHQAIFGKQFPRGIAAGTAQIGIPLSHFEHRFVNGFDYFSPRIIGAPVGATKPPPRLLFTLALKLHPELRRRMRTAATVLDRKPWRDDVKTWESEVKPHSTATHLELQRIGPTNLGDVELANHLRVLHDNAEQQCYLHHRLSISGIVPVGDYIVHAREWTGLPDAELLQVCHQPGGLETATTDQFRALIEALQDDPAAVDLLDADGPAADAIAELTQAPGRVGLAARGWLELIANRNVTGYDIVDLSAGELPGLLQRTVLAALDQVGRSDRRLAAEEAARVRDRVPAEHRQEYDDLLAEAISVGTLQEERALVCDLSAYGLVRRAVKEAGRRIADWGRIADASHLFEASHEEMLDLLTGSARGPSADQLAERHAWRTTATTDMAPKRIGPPPAAPPPASWLPPAVRRMAGALDAAIQVKFGEPAARNEVSTVRGLNASAGRYEGAARVVISPPDFDKIKPGDVLVARSTTEAYNDIMPLLGAVVTDRGGLLSHAATIAREFGIPAVVGTKEATRIIPDGARVRVDGSRGEAILV
jgi:phosphohistidine swiveling domain-containing protein